MVEKKESSHRKLYLISYATNNFKKKQIRLNNSAKRFGIKNIISYTEKDIIKTKFYKKYKHILDCKRGAGHWLWCPFLIYKTLSKINDGDLLIYSDAGTIFVNSPNPLLKLCIKENILLFTNNELNRKWTKRDCLIGMDCDYDKYINSSAKQVPTGFQIYVNNKNTRNFIKEWLLFCCNKHLIDDSRSKFQEYNGFIENKDHQSILTNLAIKKNITLYRDPSQGGNRFKKKEYRKKKEWLEYPYHYFPDNQICKISNYPTIINHLRNASKFHLLLTKIHTKLPRWLKRLTRKIHTKISK